MTVATQDSSRQKGLAVGRLFAGPHVPSGLDKAQGEKHCPCIKGTISCHCPAARLCVLPFYDIEVVSIVSLVNDMLINFDCPFKHGIEDLRKLFLQGTQEGRMAFTFAEKMTAHLSSRRPHQTAPRRLEACGLAETNAFL